MKELLFLSHRIPFPPDKGDKIRSFHWLKALSRHYRVHLGTFCDEPADMVHRQELEKYCDEICLRPLDPVRARLRSTRGLLTGNPLSRDYYRDRVMGGWVDRILATHAIDTVLVYSSPMAAYLAPRGTYRRVIDFVDMDSEKWRQYAVARHGPARWLYAREARTLLAMERALARDFDASLFVSEAEKALFDHRAPECSHRTHVVGNGVDTVYFDPAADYDDPYEAGSAPRTVFTGVMDYAPNIQAVQWFAQDVLPIVRTRCPEAVFHIVGTRPTRAVQLLAGIEGVHVTGAVADVRPYLRHADVAVAPMLIGRGVQNKVLEALAMACPVALTKAAATGLRPLGASFSGQADSAEELAAHVLRLGTSRDRARYVREAREYAIANYGWSNQFERLLALVSGGSARAVSEGCPVDTRRETLACVPHS